MAFLITEDCTGCGACRMWCPTGSIIGRRKIKHSIYSETCIECGVCGRTCGHGAVLDSQGNQQHRVALTEWPTPTWNYELCIACNACVDACSTKGIEMDFLNEIDGRIYPRLSRINLCIGCGSCETACTLAAIILKPRSEVLTIYA